MKTIKIEISEENFIMISGYAAMRNESIEKVIARLAERFAPVSHTLLEEELKKGYEESAKENLEWANL